MRGRKPKPTALHHLERTFRPVDHAARAVEPKAPGVLVEAPAWLSPAAQEGWAYALEHAPLGVLAKIDRAVLTVWVNAEDLYRTALEKCAAAGLVIRSPLKGEPMQNPYLAIANKQALIMIKAASELGFSPASRPRLGVPRGSGMREPVNPFADIGPKNDAAGTDRTH